VIRLLSGYTRGAFVSEVLEVGEGSWGLSWEEEEPGLEEGWTMGSGVSLQVRVSQDGGSWSEWMGPGGPGTFFTSPPADLSFLSPFRYLQYRVLLSSDSPELSGPSGPKFWNPRLERLEGDQGWRELEAGRTSLGEPGEEGGWRELEGWSLGEQREGTEGSLWRELESLRLGEGSGWGSGSSPQGEENRCEEFLPPELWTGTVSSLVGWGVLEGWALLSGQPGGGEGWRELEGWEAGVENSVTLRGFRRGKGWAALLGRLSKGSKGVADFTPLGLRVRRVGITPLQDVENLEVTVELLQKPSLGLSPPKKDVFFYFEVSASVPDELIERAEIEFEVPKSLPGWETAVLYHYENGRWVTLPTTKVGENEEYAYFVARSGGLSPFAVCPSVTAIKTVQYSWDSRQNSTQSSLAAGTTYSFTPAKSIYLPDVKTFRKVFVLFHVQTGASAAANVTDITVAMNMGGTDRSPDSDPVTGQYTVNSGRAYTSGCWRSSRAPSKPTGPTGCPATPR
jgi:PGF-pre-PGF domain-containing protein